MSQNSAIKFFMETKSYKYSFEFDDQIHLECPDSFVVYQIYTNDLTKIFELKSCIHCDCLMDTNFPDEADLEEFVDIRKMVCGSIAKKYNVDLTLFIVPNSIMRKYGLECEEWDYQSEWLALRICEKEEEVHNLYKFRKNNVTFDIEDEIEELYKICSFRDNKLNRENFEEDIREFIKIITRHSFVN